MTFNDNVRINPGRVSRLGRNTGIGVGGDRIQRSTQGQVTPETCTHGPGEKRQQWLTTGLNSGPDTCNTFEMANP